MSRSFLGFFVLLILLSSSRSTAQSFPSEAPRQLFPDSSMVWNPSDEDLETLRSACWASTTTVARACISEFMRSHGASDAALSFVYDRGSDRYLRYYRKEQGIVIAVEHAPMRIHDDHELLLIDSNNRIINVDNELQIARASLMQDAGYRTLYDAYPSVAFHPSDRSPAQLPVVDILPRGRMRALVEYRLTDGCRACVRIGYARIAYYFDAEGKYLAQKFLGVYGQPPLRTEGKGAECDDSKVQGSVQSEK